MIPRDEIPRAVARLAAPNLLCMLRQMDGCGREVVESCVEEAMTEFIEQALELAEKRRPSLAPSEN